MRNLKELIQTVDALCSEILLKNDLSPRDIAIKENYGKKDPTVITSYSVCIFEPVYPAHSADYGVVNCVIARIAENPKKGTIIVTTDSKRDVTIPDSAIVNKSGGQGKSFSFALNDKSLLDYIKANILYCLNNFTPSVSFGCCYLYEACSDAKKCIHENLLYSKGCKYRKNLETGKIFYGRNKV